jgi:hypothetical protein
MQYPARMLTVIIAVLVLSITVALPVFAQTAESIDVGATLSDTMTAETPVQIYAFEGTAGVTYVATAVAETTTGYGIDILDEDGQSIISSGDFSEAANAQGVTVSTATVAATPTEDGTYYILVSTIVLAVVGGEIDYALTLQGDGVTTVEPTPAATAEPTVSPTTEATPTTGETIAAALDPGQLLTTAGFSLALSWTGAADLDFEIRDPVGGSLYWETPSVTSGGSISPNVNQGCINPNVDNPTETATWSPGGIPTGSYELLVYYQQPCAGDTPVNFTITPTLDGTALPEIAGTVSPSQVFVSRVVVNADGTAEVQQEGGIVVLESIPFDFATIQASAQPIAIETTTSGFVGNDQQFQTFSFEGLANELLSVNVVATSGSLDTFVALYDAAGTVIAFNDDIGIGITDSQLDSVLLPAAGTYYVAVTRYGKATGGTEGNFDLLLTRQTVNLSQEFLSLPEGSLEFLVLWNSAADLQLLVRDPAGDSVFDDIPRINSGGTLAAQGNVNCRVSDGTPFSYIYWPLERQPRPGVYEIEVWFQQDCGDPSPVTFSLYVTFNGRQVARATEAPLPNERFLTSFTINADNSTTPSDGGIIRGVETLDYRPEIATATALLPGAAAAGSITQDNKFDVYAYDGVANSSVTIALNATSGTLDTTLYLISPSGQLIAENDDAVPGENTNSLIADFTLPEDGQYAIIVTHYGALYGGTTGTYTLTLTELN